MQAGETCSADHPFVRRTATLSTLAHGVSGSVTVVDDCTLEVINFNYDGRGPSVYFYGGQDGDYISDNAFSIGPRLNGRPWQNESLTLKIPEGKSLDDFNSVSVWCFDFNANFGEAFFDQ
ncbi:MAG: DM13 domain-containing protein [Pseudomonadota bacterium]